MTKEINNHNESYTYTISLPKIKDWGPEETNFILGQSYGFCCGLHWAIDELCSALEKADNFNCKAGFIDFYAMAMLGKELGKAREKDSRNREVAKGLGYYEKSRQWLKYGKESEKK